MTRYSITGDSSPDCSIADTGIRVGTRNGQPYWSWVNDAGTWYLFYTWTSELDPCWLISNTLSDWLSEGGGGELGWYRISESIEGDYDNTAGPANGTPIVDEIPAFYINNSSGIITISNPSLICPSQNWELRIRVVDSDSIIVEEVFNILTIRGSNVVKCVIVNS